MIEEINKKDSKNREQGIWRHELSCAPGEIWVEVGYVNGIREGLLKYFHDGDKLGLKLIYENGEQEGELIEY
ncbi:MAG TPA: hypothetical protein VMZ04_02680 [Anaerolineae bacterium]|nr:hypothetical protein [Anaerolineae bacterium]